MKSENYFVYGFHIIIVIEIELVTSFDLLYLIMMKAKSFEQTHNHVNKILSLYLRLNYQPYYNYKITKKTHKINKGSINYLCLLFRFILTLIVIVCFSDHLLFF